MPPRGLAARAGRWSARHRKTAIVGWLAFVVVAMLVGGSVGTKKLADADSGAGESRTADRAVARAFPHASSNEAVLVQARSGALSVRSGAFRAAVGDVVRRVEGFDTVARVRSPLAPGNRGQISRDGRSALVQFEVLGADEIAAKRVVPVEAAVKAAAAAHPGLRIEQFGDASVSRAIDGRVAADFHRAEFLSLPVTLAILVIAFGALVAAGIPVLLAITAVMAALGITSLLSHVMAVDDAIAQVVLLVGMAVGVDYALFYLRRAREERAAGHTPADAIDIAAATSGRAVLVSGLTVMLAMAGMFLTGDPTFSSFAMGTIVVVAVAMLGSLTVLPALLSALGTKVDRGRIPLLGRRSATGRSGRAWGVVVDAVLRRPLVSAVAATAFLVTLTIPAFGLHTAESGASGLPRSMPIVRTYDRIQAAFPGGQLPAEVVVQADDVTAAPVVAALRDLRRRALATGRMQRPIDVRISAGRRVAVVSIPLAGDGTDRASDAALAALRDTVIPATVGRLPGVRADVTGMTAGSKDFNDLMKGRLPLVFGFVLVMAFLLLLVTFRSIVIPAQAIVLNLLSVGAAYGVLVLVFQHAWAESLLGFHSTGGIASWLPMFLFVLLFGLSMDYHVFILSRIREAWGGGRSTDAAVSEGIRATAGAVTSAAIVMVSVFAIFATLSMVEMKQMGIGLAAAVLIDATVIRGVLLPATMKLLGEWNWYLPPWLEWLPRFGEEPSMNVRAGRPSPPRWTRLALVHAPGERPSGQDAPLPPARAGRGG